MHFWHRLLYPIINVIIGSSSSESGNFIITETSDPIITESGDMIITEQ